LFTHDSMVEITIVFKDNEFGLSNKIEDIPKKLKYYEINVDNVDST
jgi:hypothetical protein